MAGDVQTGIGKRGCLPIEYDSRVPNIVTIYCLTCAWGVNVQKSEYDLSPIDVCPACGERSIEESWMVDNEIQMRHVKWKDAFVSDVDIKPSGTTVIGTEGFYNVTIAGTTISKKIWINSKSVLGMFDPLVTDPLTIQGSMLFVNNKIIEYIKLPWQRAIIHRKLTLDTI